MEALAREARALEITKCKFARQIITEISTSIPGDKHLPFKPKLALLYPAETLPFTDCTNQVPDSLPIVCGPSVFQ